MGGIEQADKISSKTFLYLEVNMEWDSERTRTECLMTCGTRVSSILIQPFGPSKPPSGALGESGSIRHLASYWANGLPPSLFPLREIPAVFWTD